MRRASIRALVVSGALSLLAFFIPASTASANVSYPDGCLTAAEGFEGAEWGVNCWLGENGAKYDNYAAYVQGMQIILYGLGYYGMGIDGRFASHTYAAVKEFQAQNGLSADGIVGTGTWNLLASALSYSYSDCSGDCWWVYSSPGTIGDDDWTLGDYYNYPWGYDWGGAGQLFSDDYPVNSQGVPEPPAARNEPGGVDAIRNGPVSARLRTLLARSLPLAELWKAGLRGTTATDVKSSASTAGEVRYLLRDGTEVTATDQVLGKSLLHAVFAVGGSGRQFFSVDSGARAALITGLGFVQAEIALPGGRLVQVTARGIPGKKIGPPLSARQLMGAVRAIGTILS